MILALLGVLLAQDPLIGAGLDPIGQQLFVAAVEHEQQGEWSRAAAAYELVLRRDPTYAAASLGRARATLQLGEIEETERILQQLPMDADAVEMLAGLVKDDRPEEAVELYARLRTLRLGDAEPWRFESEARLLAGDVPGSIETLEQYLLLGGGDEDPDAASIHMVSISEALKDSDDREGCRAWLERTLQLWPEGELADEVRARLDRLDVEQAAEELAVGGGESLDPEQGAELGEIRQQMAAGRLDQAAERLDVLVEQAPRSPEVWAAIGDVSRDRQDVGRAEQAYLTAVALDPDEATWRVRLGVLLAERYGGRRHREAREELERAHRMRPDWVELDYLLGSVCQDAGDVEAAVEHFRSYGERAPDGEFAESAARAVADLTRVRPEPPEVEALLAAAPEGIPEAAWSHFKLSKVYLERHDDDERARLEVDLALAEAPDYVDALNLLAHLQLRALEVDAAVVTYERSLAVRPDQPRTVLAVGWIHEDAGRAADARAKFEVASELGAEEAWYALALLADADGDWLEARRLLAEYFARSSGGRKHDAALELREELENRYRLTFGGGGLAALAAVTLPLGWWIRRRTGSTLRQLLEQVPETYHDVATIVAGMRHEVLKHNTTVLPAAADALDAGNRQLANESVDRLVEGGIRDKWFGYIRELESLGRHHRMRLNLRRVDPVLAPMCDAFDELGRGSPTADDLRNISEILNETGYMELGRILRDVCVMNLDRSVLGRAWDHVRSEPGFRGEDLPELQLDVEVSLPVRIFPGELDDIVVNLLRNSLQAVLDEQAPGERRLGLSLSEDVDFVTGLEWVVLRFFDNATSPLTTEMIRGRYIARGFGLTVDLVTRHEGSIQVEDAAGWAKSITVRLPRAEEPEA
ncbi:MAG: tetratricopeptide repeat protein [Proteobacteria bacterium]|nr:tetratricopeptide repeat protein [Pseudomonadota bacterium]MCP4919335.1 tetratricopeptide repeat protein [Pseudomonadota bacterium]